MTSGSLHLSFAGFDSQARYHAHLAQLLEAPALNPGLVSVEIRGCAPCADLREEPDPYKFGRRDQRPNGAPTTRTIAWVGCRV
jgi:hypothetical protein